MTRVTALWKYEKVKARVPSCQCSELVDVEGDNEQDSVVQEVVDYVQALQAQNLRYGAAAPKSGHPAWSNPVSWR